MSKISLVIFTCEGREHLLKRTYDSFTAACNFQFDQVILAIDGVVNASVISYINPDLVVYGFKRKGYVTSIKNTLANIKTEYFFWLEDDWLFQTKLDVPFYLGLLEKHTDWAEIVYSKYGPLTDVFKINQLAENLYQNANGYSANPGFNRTALIREAFSKMNDAQKMDGAREIGFENFLTGYYDEKGIKYALIDPVDHTAISHEGYLETTPRNWHMMSSLEKKTEKHLLTFPKPSFGRRLFMIVKLMKTMLSLSFRQLFNDEIYDLCFRVIAVDQSTRESANATTGNNDRNG